MKFKLTKLLVILTLFSSAAIASEILWRLYNHTKDMKTKKLLQEEAEKKVIQAEAALSLRKPPNEWNTVFFFPDPNHELPDSATSKVFDLISKAKLSIQICMFVTSMFQLERIILQKQKEGLLIQVVTDHDSMTAHNNINCKNFKRGRKFEKFNEPRTLKWNFSSGIPVRTRNTGHLMHNKFIVIDEEAVCTGSLNFTQRGFYGCSENIIFTTEPRIVKEYVQQFGVLWRQCNEGL